MGREKRRYADRAAYMVKAVDKRRKKFVRCQSIIRADHAQFVDMVDAIMRLSFIIEIQVRKILASQRRAIPEAGKKLKPNLISAFYFVQIATEKYMMV
ncbi:hypothetical protein KKA13_04605 [Patescibacteria group bacterium]|nr:hypothetical protein [Patescibacteria group bacterium]